MADSSITTTPAPAAPKPEKKPLFETVITSTPVIMTVIATLFAGMSASEMTWAQFHRATAAQHQSKAGDQWAFFQAKKIRGTSMEMTSTLLRALSEPGHFDAAAPGTIGRPAGRRDEPGGAGPAAGGRGRAYAERHGRCRRYRRQSGTGQVAEVSRDVPGRGQGRQGRRPGSCARRSMPRSARTRTRRWTRRWVTSSPACRR